jgi:ClpP class serine protease
LKAGKPLLIDPLKAHAFLKNAELLLGNPEIAYQLSAYAAKGFYNPTKEVGPKAKRFVKQAPQASDDDELDPLAAAGMYAVSSAPYVREGIGVIPIYGVIGKGLSPLEAMLGCADIEKISEQLDAWDKDDNVFEVLLKVDSGGGSTTGMEEFAKKIRNYQKPTISFSDSDCGSAAFWAASQCKRFVCTPSASIGACGVYITMVDESEKFKKEGREVVVIKSGKYKAAGVEGTSLSSDQMESLQDEVDELHQRFIRDVRSVRQFASLDDLQGQSFYGDKAAQRGLATGVVDSFEALIEDIKNTRRQAHRQILPSMYAQPQTPTSMEGLNPYIG